MPARLKSNRARGNPNKMFGHLTIDFSNEKMKWITGPFGLSLLLLKTEN